MSGRLPPTINSSNTSTQQQPSYPQHLYHPSHQSSSLNPSPLTMMSAPSPVDNNNPTIINNSNPMTNTTNPLLSHCKERIHQTKQRHAYQLNQLDLNLETTPRDSRYSPTLLELMRKEEVLLKEGGGSGGSGGGAAAGGNQQQLSQATKTLMQKVDDSLKIETKHFFAKLTAANLKKWEMLQEKLKKERDQLKSEFYRELQNQQISLSSIPNPSLIPLNQIYKKPSPGQIITAEDLAKEEERLNLDYHQRWYQIEMIHLQEAFRLQSCKIDSDWGQHERTIRNEYETKKASLLPKGSSDFQSHQNNLDNEQQQQQRWHSAEKQKTLIHTAPVFTPSTHQLNRPSSSNVAKKRDSASPSALNHEVNKLPPLSDINSLLSLPLDLFL